MSVRPPRLTGVGLSHPHVCACACTRVWACAYACVHACVWACVCACACAYPRVYARRRVRMGACAYMRGYGTVSGGGMRLSDVGSCLVIVAWCNCCICNHVSMWWRPGLCGAVGFCSGCGCFDTPVNASNCNGFGGGLRYRFALRMGCMYSDSYQPRNDKKETTR